MIDADAKTFGADLAMVAEVFGETLSPLRLRAYFAALEDLDVAAVRAALRQAVKTCRFFPKPAEVRELVTGNVEDRGAFAWSQVMLSIRGKPNAMDATAADAIELMGGWREVDWLTFRHVTPVDVAMARKHFLTMYRVAAARAEAPARLAGAQAMLPEPR